MPLGLSGPAPLGQAGLRGRPDRALQPRAPLRPAPGWLAAALLTALLGLASGCGRDPSSRPLADRIREARGYVEDLQARTGVPALAVAVAIDGDVVWSEGLGWANVERQVPATAQTLFRVGSVAKVFTAAAVARLVEQGALDLDAPVQRYVPEFPDKGQPITTRQLTGHLSGVRHYRWDETRPTAPTDDVIDALGFFRDDPLESAPGSRFSYSSYGWVLVSAVVQRAAGEPFAEHLRARVFDPLDMQDTRPETNDPRLANRATLYEGGRPVAPDEISYIRAAGGFLSTVEDMARFGSAFLPGSPFLAADTLEMVFTPQSTRDGQPSRFGLGWVVDELSDGTPVYHHPGTVKGGHSALLVNPEDRIVVALAANQSSGFAASECQRVACAVLGTRDCPQLAGEMTRRAIKAEQVPALLGALSRWQGAMESGDLDGVLATLSAGFASDLWPGRSDLERSLGGGGLAVDTEDIHVRSSGWDVGAVVRVERVRIGPGLSAIEVVLQLVREESGWRVSSVQRQD